MKKILSVITLVLLPVFGSAASFPFSATGLATSQSFTLDLQKAGVNSLSAQATYSSATIPSRTFTAGIWLTIQ